MKHITRINLICRNVNIISVNTDESAPIFKYAKFGIVADCNDFLDELIEELKKIK